MQSSWRSLRTTMLVVAVVAVALNGFRELPGMEDNYQFWQGVRRARRDVELAGAASGLDSTAARRAQLNFRQSQIQAEAFWRLNLPGPVGLLCVAISIFLVLGLTIGGPIWGLRIILRRIVSRRRASPEVTPLTSRCSEPSHTGTL
jgi:hypothetical protein